MIPGLTISRRQLLKGTVLAPGFKLIHSTPLIPLKGSIYKTLKIGMIQVQGSLTQQFQAAKDAGFQGIELNAPGINLETARQASAKTGLIIDGTVCASHWQVRHTDAQPSIRLQALKDLKAAILQTHSVGGHSVLLVPGHGKDGPEKEIWQRSIDNIKKAIPLASKLGIYIAIENVWNHFLYDHKGGNQQTADKLAQYVDDLASPWVGIQFDIGNHWKYGNTGDWIRTLGTRIIKLDAKGFTRQKNEFTKIGEGDLDWLGVRRALAEIQFQGWCAAEVKGGGPKRLREIAQNLDLALGL